MALEKMRGHGNDRETFKELIGEKVTACFEEGRELYIVFGDNALVLTSLGGECGPAFWVDGGEKLKRIISKRREGIERHLAELRDMPGVDLP